MLAYNKEEIFDSFRAAPNVNAALKKFLKNEVKRGDPIERFTKDLRTAVSGGRDDALKSFIDRSLPDYEPHLMVISRYLYNNAIEEIISGIYERHADQFNETYSLDSGSFEYKDQSGFEKIIADVAKEVDAGIGEHELPATPYMRNVIHGALFDEQVMPEVYRVLGSLQ